MVSVKINLIRKSFKSSRISIPDEYSRDQFLTIPNTAIHEKDGEYFVYCEDKEIPNAKSINVSHDDMIFED